MKRLKKTAALLMSLALLTAHLPLTAQLYNPTVDGEDDDFDGQAYYAARYEPATRPVVVVGYLTLAAILVVILQNNTHNSHNHGH
ncbi:MAG: hypothetical protein Q8K75_11895 [Chlamydiales bacterium]|nr:hypothetical protein [Chlamydiales bacterium]